ncbi:hypothetical protein ABT063_32805 [Streptomyces sp. NPDC002838]|uniref:hypothetical protein n=1 Tax=Streptomyces sp. NPDC002838 TaxID=3154436 RepID=UPI0033289683
MTADGPARVPPLAGGTRAVLDGTNLDVATLVRLADGTAVPTVPPEAYERARRSGHTAQRLAAVGRLYGRGTGRGRRGAVAGVIRSRSPRRMTVS